MGLKLCVFVRFRCLTSVAWFPIFRVCFLFFGLMGLCLQHVGLLCFEGEGEACDKLTSEIMITGYCIMALLVSCGAS